MSSPSCNAPSGQPLRKSSSDPDADPPYRVASSSSENDRQKSPMPLWADGVALKRIGSRMSRAHMSHSLATSQGKPTAGAAVVLIKATPLGNGALCCCKIKQEFALELGDSQNPATHDRPAPARFHGPRRATMEASKILFEILTRFSHNSCNK